MRNRNGRRARKRRRKRGGAVKVTLSHEVTFVDLRRWLKQKGFSSKCLLPASFTDTGRGLMVTQPIKANELVISLPEKCLLTTSSVLKSYMGEYIKRWKPPVSPLIALCSFLIAERYHGDSAEWSPYINILPKSYTCPVYFSDDIMDLLPLDVRIKAASQKEQLEELYISSLPFFLSLQPIFVEPVEEVFTQDAVRWAWCSVNTRTVYMEHAQSRFLSREKDVFALAPYLDLLNHRPDNQVHAGFNDRSRHYEIRSVHGCEKFQQAFICYGPHDNQRLLLEYGFVASDNQHSAVYVDLGTLRLCVNEADRQLQQKLLFLKDNDFLRNLTFGVDGPSWRLMTALRLLSLEPKQYSCWKQILLGAAVSQDREDWCLHKALMLCQHLCDDNSNTLSKIAKLKDCADGARLEQVCLVESLRHEERVIIERSKLILQNTLLSPSPWQPNRIEDMEH